MDTDYNFIKDACFHTGQKGYFIVKDADRLHLKVFWKLISYFKRVVIFIEMFN